MPRLPDRFDLQVRKARARTDPVRQADYVLGALSALPEWYFYNLGTKDSPNIARTEIDTDPYVLVYSDPNRVEEILLQTLGNKNHGAVPIITVATEAALRWCVEIGLGLFINAPEDAVMIPALQVKNFYEEWQKRGKQPGFWIPNMTSEEEDFWQEHEV